MKYPENLDYMATATTIPGIIETVTDVNNSFLSRRELTCNFAGLGGKLKSLQAVDMITKKFKLDAQGGNINEVKDTRWQTCCYRNVLCLR